MELVDRYLQAVRFFLPKGQQDDVVRELSEELRSQIEEQEGERGQPLDQDELSALLKRFGHPVVLALRYQQGRSLIGPAIFPLYWFAVRSLLGILAIVHLLLPAIFFLLTQEGSVRIPGLFLRFPAVAMAVLAWITLGFAVLETAAVRSAVERALSSWSPRSLPALVGPTSVKPPSVAGFVLGVLLSAWWLAGLHFPRLLLGPAADYVTFGPIFERLYVPMVVAAVASAALGWLRLSRPHLTRFASLSDLLVDGIGLVLLYLLSRGSDWVVAGERLGALPGHQGLVEIVNLATQIGLAIGLVAGAIAFAWKCLVHLRGWPGRANSHRPARTDS